MNDTQANLAAVIAETGHPGHALLLADRAETLTDCIRDPVAQAQALANLAAVIAETGHPGHARLLADRAEALTETITDPAVQANVLAALATAITHAGDPDRARRLWARAFVIDPLQIGWIETVSQFFPSVIGNARDVLIGAYMTQA